MTDKARPRPRAIDGPVRLTLPARVANELGGLQRSLAALAERSGHPQCATGCDTLFLQVEREFTVLADEVALNPQPLPPRETPPGRRVDVLIPAKVSDDIKALQKAVAVTVQKLGCDACCSGFDITFRRELDLLVLDGSLKAKGYGRFA